MGSGEEGIVTQPHHFRRPQGFSGPDSRLSHQVLNLRCIPMTEAGFCAEQEKGFFLCSGMILVVGHYV